MLKNDFIIKDGVKLFATQFREKDLPCQLVIILDCPN